MTMQTYKSSVGRSHIIQELPVDLTTEDEGPGTDHRHGMAVMTNRPVTGELGKYEEG